MIDFEASRFFRQRPRNVAFEVDFNRFETQNYPPDALETAFGQFEGKTASVIRRICSEERLPEDEEFSYVLNLIALLAVRNPSMRRSMDTARSHMWRVAADTLASGKALFESQLRSAPAGGFVTQKEVSFERVRDFIRKGEYTNTYDSQEPFIATPTAPLVFGGWGGTLAGSATPLGTTATAEVIGTANFNLVAAPLTFTSISPASIPVSSPAQSITISGSGFTAANTSFYLTCFPVKEFVRPYSK